MNNTKRILQYLLIVVGIIVPIYLGNVLKMNTASDSGVALKDIPAEAVTCTGAAQGMNGPVTVEVVATKDRIYSVKVVDQKETEGIGTVAAVEIPAKIFEKQSVQVRDPDLQRHQAGRRGGSGERGHRPGALQCRSGCRARGKGR